MSSSDFESSSSGRGERQIDLPRTTAINLAWSFAARVWSAGVLLIALPYIVHRLGTELYGLLTLTMLVVGYFSFFDLGLGQAIVKFLTEARARGDDRESRSILGTATVLYYGTGIFGSALFAAMSPVFANHVFNIPPALKGTALAVFLVGSLAVFVSIPQFLFQSVPTAYHRIYLVSVLNAAVFTARTAAVVVVLGMGFSILAVLGAYVVTSALQLAALVFLARRTIGAGALRPRWEPAQARRLLAYGFHVSISQSAAGFIVSVDKLLIGILLPMANLAYYVVAFEPASRLWEVPRNVVNVAMPIFSELSGGPQKGRLARVYVSVSRVVFAGSVHGALLLVVFADVILSLWMGPDFARAGTILLRLFAVGVLVSASISSTLTLANALGRPDIPAKTHLLILLLNVILCLILIPRFGLVGAAIAWLAVHVVDLVLMVSWVHRALRPLPTAEYAKAVLLRPLGLSAAVALATLPAKPFADSLVSLLLIMAASYGIYLALTYVFVIPDDERQAIRRLVPAIARPVHQR